MFFLILLIHFLQKNINDRQIFLPVDIPPETEMQLAEIGQFGILRSNRPGIPGHLHTGIDIRRPSQNFENEFIYPISKGKVISKRDDGAYAQLIIKHIINDTKFWTLYEHIAGIMVSVGDSLYPYIPIARFMNREELNRYGWQFNHFHFEILKIQPETFKVNPLYPERFFMSKTLTIYNQKDLQKYYFNPIKFLKNHSY